MGKNIVKVSGLHAYYEDGGRGLRFKRQKSGRQHILHDVSFELAEGEIVGLVGESGSGKSTLAKSLLGMVEDVSGDISHKTARPQMVFQDPYGSLNPARKIGWLLEEPLRVLGGLSGEERKERVAAMLNKVGLNEQFAGRYPSELSGGQRQRVCIGQALMQSPKLIIADEPVSALDVTVQAQILRLLKELQQEYGMAILFISHDLRVVYQLCSRILVLKDGRIVEEGDVREVYRDPEHPYTKLLLSAAGILNYKS